MFFPMPFLSAWALDWHTHSPKPFPFWVPLASFAAIATSPFSFRDGLIGIGIYVFVGLSIQGSDVASRALFCDGVLDWTIFLVGLSYGLGQLSRKAGAATSNPAKGAIAPGNWSAIGVINESKLKLSIDLLSFILWSLIAWVAISWAVKLVFSDDWGTPLPYRRPILWLHCGVLFTLASRCLYCPTRRADLAFLSAFALLWRVLMSRDSLWLEGHIASFIVLTIPWLWCMSSNAVLPHARLFRSTLLVLLGVFLISIYVEPSWMGLRMIAALGREILAAVVLLIATLIAILPKTIMIRSSLSLLTLASCLGVLGIQNRAAIVALVLCVALCTLLNVRPIPLLAASVCILFASWFTVRFTDYAHLVNRFTHIFKGNDSSVERLELWRSAVQMSQDHALLGVGAGQFPDARPRLLAAPGGLGCT